jgi:hypothetical protein
MIGEVLSEFKRSGRIVIVGASLAGLRGAEALRNEGFTELDAALAPARTWLAHAHELHLLALYESRISRSVEKNMARLRTLQGRRKYAPVEAQLEHFLTPRLEGGNHDPAGDVPAETPDSSVRFFEDRDPASDSPEPVEFTEKSAVPSLNQPPGPPGKSPLNGQPRDQSPGTTGPNPPASRRWTMYTPSFGISGGEWVRNPLGQPTIRR